MLRKTILILPIFCILTCLSTNAFAWKDYHNTVPNGNRYGCGLCHIANAPSPGAPNFEFNRFGTDYRRIAIAAGNVVIPLWTRDLANLDSDGDGYTNGEELQETTGNIFVWEPRKFGPGEEDWDLASGTPSFSRNPGDGDLSVPGMPFSPSNIVESTINVGETLNVSFSVRATVPDRQVSAELTGKAKELEGVRIEIRTETEEANGQTYHILTGSVFWTPTEQQGGDHTIAIQLTDGTSVEVGTIKVAVFGGIVQPGGEPEPPPPPPPVKITDLTVATFDFNNSLRVDLSDFTLFASAYGQVASLNITRFDFDKSGFIDWHDFLFFTAFYNRRVNNDVNYRTPFRDQITFVPVEGGRFVQEINGLFQQINILPHEMGKYEISNRQYNNFYQHQGATLALTPFPYNSEVFADRTARLPDHPVIGVSWEMADAYCKWAGGRLPLAKEWTFAARGTESRKYAHGETLKDNQANFQNSNDPFEPGTTPIGYYSGRLHHGFQTSDTYSLYGAYDMTGNVWEWCGDLRTEVTPNQAPIKGGSYVESSFSNDQFISTEQWLEITEKRANIGFRCLIEK